MMSARSHKKASQSRRPTLRSPFRRRDTLTLGIVLAAALALRVVYLLHYRANLPYYDSLIVDAQYYDAWAQRVAAGRGYGPSPFYMAPLYPYVLALIYLVFGHNLTIVYGFQALLGVVNLLLAYCIARRLFGHTSGILAVVLMSLYAPLMYLESKVLTETLALTLNLTSILLLMKAVERPSALRFLYAGVLMGLSAVCRPNALIFVALGVIWVWVAFRSARKSARLYLLFLVLSVMSAILPVTARNYFIGKDIALITTNGGIVFAQGNGPGADGVSTPLAGFTNDIGTQQEEEMAIAEKELGHDIKPSEASAYWLRQSLAYIRERPGEFAWLLARKLIWSLHNREARCSYNFYLERSLVPILRWPALPFSAMASLALFGFLRSRSRNTSLLALYVLSVFLSLMIFSVSSRYRVPMVPALAVLAGFGVTELANVIVQRKARIITLAAVCLVSVPLVSLVPYPVAPITEEALANLGDSYVALGRVDKAIPKFRGALKLNPDFAEAHNSLGAALASRGDVEEAIAEFRAAVRSSPRDPLFHYNLGLALAQQDRPDDAAASLRQALSLKPGFREARNKLGELLAKAGRLTEAEDVFREGIAVDPDDYSAHFNLGLVLLGRGRTDEAIGSLRDSVRIKPDYGKGHRVLALALFRKGYYAEAQAEARFAQRHGADIPKDVLRALSERMPKSD